MVSFLGGRSTAETTEVPPDQRSVYSDGDLKYTIEEAGNDSKPSYQEASGAPVEGISPLGTHVGTFSVIFLNIGKMIGTGVFSTRRYLFE